MASKPSVECVADVKAVLGESPVWVEAEQALYWVDIKGRRIFRLDARGNLADWPTPVRVGSIAPRQSAGFIAGTDEGVFAIDLSSNRFDKIADPEAGLPDNRFNDGKVDRSGRFWLGSMDDTERVSTGTLYRVGSDLTVEPIDSGYKVTNGPAFSPDGRTMYHNDSARQVTYAFDLDADGNATNRREFARYGADQGYPDGMTVDCEGGLWIAFWDGWCVRRYSQDGDCMSEIAVPVARPTSCAFGGAKLDQLYISSASIGLDEQARSMQPTAGGLFMTVPGVGGIAERPFAG